MDHHLQQERRNQTDTEWGSVHHVLYGMCSGTDVYHVPIWYNEKSNYSYLNLIIPIFEKLEESYRGLDR